MKPIQQFQEILIFNPSFIGDTVLTTPLIRAVGKLWPKAKVTFCVRPECAGLYEGLPLVSRVITFDKRSTASGITGMLKFAAALHKYKFDLVINLHKSLRSSVLFWFVKPTYIIGFSQAVFSFMMDETVDRDMSLHEVERNLCLLRVLTDGYNLADAKRLGGALACNIDHHIASNAQYYCSTVTPMKKIIGIAPGSVWKTKRWSAEYFAITANALYEKGYAIALFGSAGDKEACEIFAEHFKYDYYDYYGKTSVAELPAFISSIRLLIVNDSGLLHIAIAADVPCVAIFGATVKSLGFFPYDTKSVVVENDSLDCRPCGKHGGNKCPRQHFRCMLDIMPERVTAAALTILEANA